MFKELMRFSGMVFATSLTLAAFVAFAPVAKSADMVGVGQGLGVAAWAANNCGLELTDEAERIAKMFMGNADFMTGFADAASFTTTWSAAEKCPIIKSSPQTMTLFKRR